MKSISQILKGTDLEDLTEVQELIEYTQDLENQVIEFKQKKQHSFEDKLAEVVRDIYSSCETELNNDFDAIRFGEAERVDFEDGVRNLKKYIADFARDNKFRL